MTTLVDKFRGQNVGARVRRSTVWSFLGFGGGQLIRLASNLILTRLLFPEAFGLMALMMVVLTGLKLFSDTGIRGSIIQHNRGDDLTFLDTAWTIQVIRGVLLWAMTFAIAGPLAQLYDAPELAQMLPVAGFALLIKGLQPTAVHTVNRHLALGRMTQITLSVQVTVLVITALLAWQMLSVWALVIGALIGSALQTGAEWLFLPNANNRLRIEGKAFWQIFHFGKWVFVATIAGFVVNQGDRAILGLYISLSELGIYNIAFMLASVPVTLSMALQGKVVFPLYRMKPPTESVDNQLAIFRTRRLLASGLIATSIAFAFAGPWIIEVLYDSRYYEAGPILTLLSLSLIPQISLNGVGQALYAAGDARRAFFVIGLTALLQFCFLLIGIAIAGIVGAVLSIGIAVLASYPLRYIYARRIQVWDPVQDIGITVMGLVLCGAACIHHFEKLLPLFAF